MPVVLYTPSLRALPKIVIEDFINFYDKFYLDHFSYSPPMTMDELNELQEDAIRYYNIKYKYDNGCSSSSYDVDEYMSQSGTEGAAPSQIVATTEEGDAHEVIKFHESATGESTGISSEIDSVASDLYMGNYELSKYMSRPVLLQTYTINTSDSFSVQETDVWYEFLNNSAIKNKIQNFAYLQGELHLKVIVKCSPFFYGYYSLKYLPLVDFNDHHSVTTTDTNDRIQLSQRKGIDIIPQKNMGGEFTCPFFYHKNWLPINDADAVRGMGKTSFFPYQILRSANGNTTSGIDVNIYAWMENVKLAGPTADLALQSGIEKAANTADSMRGATDILTSNDKYGKGPVSKIASTIAGLADKVEDVPVIGPFAKVASFGSRLVGGVASLFGFTNLPVIDDVEPFKDVPFHAFANAEIGVPTEKLCLDPKNELTIDSRTVGLDGTDELSFSYLGNITSYLDEFEWEQSQVKSNYIMQINVAPTHYQTQSIGTTIKVFDTPMCMASRLYSNWRGEMVYTIKIIKSQYHSGALQITYDPVAQLGNSNDYSTQAFSSIIDIQEADEFEFRVPMLQDVNFLRVNPNVTTAVADHGIDTTLNGPQLGYDEDYYNGRIRVSVFNKLTGPISTAPVQVQLFVKCDKLQLSNPSNQQTLLSNFDSQSGMEKQEKSLETKSTVFGDSKNVDPKAYLVNFGENHYSLRPMMRRTCKNFSVTFGESNDTTQYVSYNKVFSTRLPTPYGYAPSGTFGRNFVRNQADTGNAQFNYANMNPIVWIAPCFAGMRGSIDWHVNADNPDALHTVYVERLNDNLSTDTKSSTTVSSANVEVLNKGALDNEAEGLTGLSLINQKTQTGLQFVHPMFNKFRLISTNSKYWTTGWADDDTINEKNVVVSKQLSHRVISSTDHTVDLTQLDFYCNIGADFNTFYFVGCVPRYLYSTQVPNVSA